MVTGGTMMKVRYFLWMVSLMLFWLALGGMGAAQTGMNEAVYAMTVFDDGSGSGPALYVGGDFTTAGGVVVNGIAKWDGTQWSALGSGMAGVYHGVHALAVFDDGSGLALYAGGAFDRAGGVVAPNIAKWDGQRWWPLYTGLRGGSRQVNALAVFNNALYAGGWFDTAGDVTANYIAKWDGQRWSSVGGAPVFG